MKILVIAAHPDDELLGVGGTLLRHIENKDEVAICIVTNTYEPEWDEKYREIKSEEQKKVDEFIGIVKRYNLDYPTVKLNTIPHGELNKKVTEVVDAVNPDIVYTHNEGDLNDDHSIVYRAALVATRPPRKIRLVCFETLSETEWGYKPFQPNLWAGIEKTIEKKIEAFKIYKSEVKAYPHPRSPEGIRILAKKRGMEINVEYAEAFRIVRDRW